jgi:hypothetical protein
VLETLLLHLLLKDLAADKEQVELLLQTEAVEEQGLLVQTLQATLVVLVV